MSKIVFSLTEPQVTVLVKVKRGEELGWRDSGTANGLRRRGLLAPVIGGHYCEYTLTPLGVLAGALAVALAPAKPRKK